MGSWCSRCLVEMSNEFPLPTPPTPTPGAVYFINFLLGFQIGAMLICGMKRLETRRGGTVAGAYVRYGKFWINLMAIVPLVYLLGLLASGTTNQSWAVLLQLLRMVRLLRFISLSKVSCLVEVWEGVCEAYESVRGAQSCMCCASSCCPRWTHAWVASLKCGRVWGGRG